MPRFEPVAGSFPNYHDTIPPRTTRLTATGLPADAPAAQWLAQSAQLMQSLLQRAIDEGEDIRPIGGDWSFSAIGSGGQTMLAPDSLGPSWPVEAGWMAADATLTPANLRLAAGGISIKALNRALEAAGQSLWTSGASNGQSIAGAIATGTHGSVPEAGGIQTHVAALHLVVSPGRSIWLERVPVLDPEFTAGFASEHRVDPDLFDAAVVHLGAMGLVNAVLLTVAPLYHVGVVQRRQRLKREQIALLEQGRFADFANLFDFGMARGTTPLFVQLILNPFRPVGTTALIRMLVPAVAPSAVPEASLEGMDDEADTNPVNILSRAVGILRTATNAVPETAGPDQGLLDRVRALIDPDEREEFDLAIDDLMTMPDSALPGPAAESAAGGNVKWQLLIWLLMRLLFKPRPRRGVVPAGRLWGATTPDHKKQADIFSGAIAIPRARLLEGIAIMSAAFVSTGGAPTSMTVRFVRRSAGLLAFTRFDHGAVIDFDGLRHPDSARAYRAIVEALVARDFPFTQHWGKMGDIDRANLEAQFGARLDAWRELRATLLDDPAVRALFSNRLVRDLGLA